MREMTDPDGGFYSAEDADSVPPEQADVRPRTRRKALLSLARRRGRRAARRRRAVVSRRFGIEPDGNAPPDPQQEFTGKNLLYVARSVDELAAEFRTSAR